MVSTLLNESNGSALWIDVVNPAEAELAAIAEQYFLHVTSVHDCLDSSHLPKHEQMGETTFIIVRAFDDSAGPTDNTLQAMTKKIALFLGDRFFITVHRAENEILQKVAQKYTRKDPDEIYLQVLALEILLEVAESYRKPLTAMEKEIADFEAIALTRGDHAPRFLNQMKLKTRLNVIRRLLWHTLASVQKFVPHASTNQHICQDLKERIESLQFFADKLVDDLNNLLDIQVNISSHRMMESANRTNEVVRFLTVVSLFFLPINFIASMYGMNFEHMPELKWKYGYAMVWVVIVVIEVAIYYFFRRMGWLGWVARPRKKT